MGPSRRTARIVRSSSYSCRCVTIVRIHACRRRRRISIVSVAAAVVVAVVVGEAKTTVRRLSVRPVLSGCCCVSVLLLVAMALRWAAAGVPTRGGLLWRWLMVVVCGGSATGRCGWGSADTWTSTTTTVVVRRGVGEERAALGGRRRASRRMWLVMLR